MLTYKDIETLEGKILPPTPKFIHEKKSVDEVIIFTYHPILFRDCHISDFKAHPRH